MNDLTKTNGHIPVSVLLVLRHKAAVSGQSGTIEFRVKTREMIIDTLVKKGKNSTVEYSTVQYVSVS